jgi:hypothetical protein
VALVEKTAIGYYLPKVRKYKEPGKRYLAINIPPIVLPPWETARQSKEKALTEQGNRER